MESDFFHGLSLPELRQALAHLEPGVTWRASTAEGENTRKRAAATVYTRCMTIAVGLRAGVEALLLAKWD